MIFPLIKDGSIKEKLNSPLFKEIYCLSIMILCAIFWLLNFIVGAIILIVLTFIVLILFWNIDLIIPILLNSVLLVNREYKFDTKSFPIELLVLVLLMISLLCLYFFKNGFKIKVGNHKLGFLLIGISMIIPLIFKSHLDIVSLQYLLYFSGVIYFLLYMIFINSFTKDSFDFVIKVFTFLPFIILFQTLVVVLQTPNWKQNIYHLAVNYGWGIGNEAIILMLFILPFVFYRLITGLKYEKMLSIVSLLSIVVSTIFTFSRGGYLAIPLTLFVLITVTILMYFKKKNISLKQTLLLLLSLIFIYSLVIYLFKIFGLIDGIFDLDNPLNTSNRIEYLYPLAWKNFTSDYKSILFGSGLINKIDYNGRFIVYHSTIFQTLSQAGLFGMVALIIHLIQKYKFIRIKNNPLAIYILISYITVDIYGLLDNSYYMYYYMIFLVIFICSYEKRSAFYEN